MLITGHKLWIALYRRLGLEPGSPARVEAKELPPSIQPIITMDCSGQVLSQGYVNVTTTSAIVLAGNDQASYRLIINASDTDIDIALGIPAVSGQAPVLLKANGGNYEFTSQNRFAGALHGIHAGTGNKVLRYLELA